MAKPAAPGARVLEVAEAAVARLAAAGAPVPLVGRKGLGPQVGRGDSSKTRLNVGKDRRVAYFGPSTVPLFSRPAASRLC